MVIPVRKYTTTIRGSVWRPVTCTYCGCQYVYRLDISVTGSAKTAWLFGNDKVAKEADIDAKFEYGQKFREETGNFSCPNCGMYQKDMVIKMKNSAWKGTISGAFYLFILWIFFVIIINAIFASAYVVIKWLDIITLLGLLGLWGWVSIKGLIKAYQSNSDANVNKRRGQSYSYKYPVLRRLEFEQMQTQTDKN
jgi:hypothetical protein